MSFSVLKAIIFSTLFCSVTQSFLTLCNPMDCSMPGFPIHHQHLELAQTHVHRVSNAIQLSILCCPLLLLSSIFPSIRVFFLMSQFFASGGQSIGASASTSVLPKIFRTDFLLGLTPLIPLQFKGLSRVFSKTTV